MPRKSKLAAAPATEVEVADGAAEQGTGQAQAATDQADVFDTEIAKRQAEARARVAGGPSPEGTALPREPGVEPEEKAEGFRSKLPDPYNLDTINLTATKDGPKARLLRGHRPRQLLIQFDENPGQEITGQIKDEGWRWDARAQYGDHHGAWTMRLERDAEVRTTLEAERLFKRVANQLGQRNGLAPAGGLGAA